MNQKLDTLYGNFLETAHTPIKIDLKNSVTFIGKDDDAVLIKNPIAGVIKPISVTKDPEKDEAMIVTAVFSYRTAKEIENDTNKGFMFLSLLKNEMMSVAAEYVDINSVKLATFKRPGNNAGYFLELQGVAAYELRFYVQLNKGDQ